MTGDGDDDDDDDDDDDVGAEDDAGLSAKDECSILSNSPGFALGTSNSRW